MSEFINKEIWNKKIIEHNGSFLQSWEWGEFQKSLGKNIERSFYDNTPISAIECLLPLGYSYWWISHSVWNTTPVFFEKLINSCQKKKSVFIRIEPYIKQDEEKEKILLENKWKKTNDVQPHATIIIDLTKEESKLLDTMEHDTRYAIRVAERRGVTIARHITHEEKINNFKQFWKLFLATNERHNLKAYTKKYYEKLLALEGDAKTELFLAQQGGECIAGAIILTFGDTATYLYAASLKNYGKYNAPSALLWNALQSTRASGIKKLDLWGISNTNEKWKGITAFKKSFGGEELNRIGTWDHPLHNTLSLAYRILKKVV